VESIRRLTPVRLLLGAAALIVVGLAFAYLLDVGGSDEGDADVLGFVIVTLVAIVIAAFLVLWVVPREESQAGFHRPARTSLILGVLAILTLVGFWTGLPFALGVPALYLGAVGQARARGRGATVPSGERGTAGADTPSERAGGGEAVAGTVLGAGALVLGLLFCIIG
jgi:hypothetical protein